MYKRQGLGADAIGLNCGLGPQQMAALVPKLREFTGLPLVVNPNAGLPVERDGTTYYDVGPEEFASWMGEIAREGAWVVGGCCGTTPEHIKKTVELCRELPVIPVTDKKRTVISSYSRAVVVDQNPEMCIRDSPWTSRRFRGRRLTAMRSGRRI